MSSARLRYVFLGLASLILTLPLAAADEGGGGPFSGDAGNALWTLVIFVGVIIILGKYAWGPILNGMQAREEFIRNSLAEAKENREAAQAQLKEYEAKLAAAHGEVAAIVEEARRDATVLKARIEQEAREEADRIIARARREIGIATDGAIKEIYTLSARLATEVASRIVGRELDVQDQERLIQESLSALQDTSEN